jgi:DNA-binding SARP family transcriptional activator
VRLELARVAIDVERFLSHADAGLAARRGGHTREALAHFEAAEALYAGDFLEEDADEDLGERAARGRDRELCRGTAGAR